MSTHQEYYTETVTMPAPAEELVNALTHGVGLVLSVGAAISLMFVAARSADPWHLVGGGIHAITMVAVYAASTLSHSFQQPTLRHTFRRLDQAAIYLFIAGSYTPFALVYLRGGGWWFLLAVIWGIALGGFFSKAFWGHRVDAVPTWLYVFLGWLPGIAAVPLMGVVPAPGLWWMLAGGLFYTVGIIFLKHDDRVPFFHAVWHLCVIAGSACHFYAIFVYVIPTT